MYQLKHNTRAQAFDQDAVSLANMYECELECELHNELCPHSAQSRAKKMHTRIACSQDAVQAEH